jgi:cell division protease FtsH
MKLLSECAKAVALKQGSRHIAPHHMLAALQHLQPLNCTEYLIFFQELQALANQALDPVFTSDVDLLAWLTQARQAPPMNLAPELTRLISTRGGMGFALTQMPGVGSPLAGQTTSQANSSRATKTEAPALHPQVATPHLTLADVARVRQHLQATVLGQATAIEALTDALAKSLYHVGQPGPLATFMLVGASANGKTHLSQQLAAALGPGWSNLHIQLGALTDPNHTAELDGTEPSYRNAQPGRLTNHVRQHPRSVVVLEDADLAHPALLQRLMPVLTSGRLRDRFGFYPNGQTNQPPLAPPEVDFGQTILVFTTRAGHAAYTDPGFQALAAQHPQQAADTLLTELRSTPSTAADEPEQLQFPAGLWQHLGAQRLLWLQPLSLPHLCQLALSHLQAALPMFQARLGCTVHLPGTDGNLQALLQCLVLAQGPQPDARNVQHAATAWLLDPITDHLLSQARQTATAASTVSAHRHISPQACQGLQHAIEVLGPDPLRQLMRHGYKLHTTINAEALPAPGTNPPPNQPHALHLTLQTACLQRVTQAADLRGPGALQVQVPDVAFADVAGHHAVKARLHEAVHLLQHPQRLRELGVALPKGMLLYGPPGTGKTMLAKALAHEANLPFVHTTGVALRDPALLTTLLARARQYAPSVLFVDEIDALGRRDEGGHTLAINQLLTELDGFDTHAHAPVFVVAATNQRQRLDPALLRPGRIDIHIEVPTLDRDARAHFVDRYLALPHDGSLCRQTLLDQTSGMGGAALEQARREAVLEMVRTGQPHTTQALLLEHIHTLKYGPRNQRARSLRQREATAYHEAGHAVVAQVLSPDVPIAHISIDPRGNTEGFVAFDPEAMANRHMTKKEVMDEICILLAGRLSEQMFLGEDGISAGAESDLERASQLAWMAVTRWGMDDECGLYARRIQK